MDSDLCCELFSFFTLQFLDPSPFYQVWGTFLSLFTNSKIMFLPVLLLLVSSLIKGYISLIVVFSQQQCFTSLVGSFS